MGADWVRVQVRGLTEMSLRLRSRAQGKKTPGQLVVEFGNSVMDAQAGPEPPRGRLVVAPFLEGPGLLV